VPSKSSSRKAAPPWWMWWHSRVDQRWCILLRVAVGRGGDAESTLELRLRAENPDRGGNPTRRGINGR
jgi:hypothetical protein